MLKDPQIGDVIRWIPDGSLRRVVEDKEYDCWVGEPIQPSYLYRSGYKAAIYLSDSWEFVETEFQRFVRQTLENARNEQNAV